MTPPPSAPYHYEARAWKTGVTRLAGIDEAGRGPLAGPVVAAAVIIGSERRIKGLADSKLLTAEQRDKLRALVKDKEKAKKLALEAGKMLKEAKGKENPFNYNGASVSNQEISVNYINDAYVNGQDRNLFVDYVTLETAQTCSGTGSVTYPARLNHYGTCRPTCVNASADPDGDGWGYENNQTCLVPWSNVAQGLPAPCWSRAGTRMKAPRLPSRRAALPN